MSTHHLSTGRERSDHDRSATGAILSAVAGISGTCVLAIAFALGLDPEPSAGYQPWLDLAGLIVMGSGLTAVVLGLRAWARDGDHSPAILFSVVAGVLLAALAGQQLVMGLGTFTG